MSTYVTIGRNIGNQPMPERQWRLFKLRLLATVGMFTGPIASECSGTGTYEGVTEDTYLVVGSRNPNEEEYKALTAALSYLSFTFKQECIALTIAEPTFIKPTENKHAESDRVAPLVTNRARNLGIVD